MLKLTSYTIWIRAVLVAGVFFLPSAARSEERTHGAATSTKMRSVATDAAANDSRWLTLLENPAFTFQGRDQSNRHLQDWQRLARESLRDPRDLKASQALYSALTEWVVSLPVASRVTALTAVEEMKFSPARPEDLRIQAALKGVLEFLVRGTRNADPQVANAVKAAFDRSRDYTRQWNEALDRLVPLREGKPVVDHVGTVSFPDADGRIKLMNSDEWIALQVAQVGYDELKAWANKVGGDRGKKTLAILATYRAPEKPQPPVAPAPVPAPAKPAPATPKDGLSARQRAIADPFVQSVLDKCIACHVMSPNTRASELLTRESLSHALRSGEAGTYQRKIHDMLGARAEQRHIHFVPDELKAIASIYFNTREDENPGPAPRVTETISAAEAAYPTDSPRARALKTPVVTYGLMRCLACHRAPDIRGTGEVNTLSKLRAAMRTLDLNTLQTMIQKGYAHPRLFHIQDLTKGEYKDRPLPLEKALRDLVSLPVDKPRSGGNQ